MVCNLTQIKTYHLVKHVDKIIALNYFHFTGQALLHCKALYKDIKSFQIRNAAL
jgi:hypothetical protein